MLVYVKKKAQITIPLKIRETVGIDVGDVLDIFVKDNKIILKPVRPPKIKLRPVDASVLNKMVGIVSIGGDAVKDSEAIWDEDNT
ncbi:MAG: AbrB/MazE/SpoVT family DNA-binding domain-containing protein [Nitrospirota bacterium]